MKRNKAKPIFEKLIVLFVIIIGLLSIVATSSTDEKDDTSTSSSTSTNTNTSTSTSTSTQTTLSESIKGYHSSLENLVVKNHAFVESVQAWEGANLDSMDVTSALALVNKFITSGENLSSAIENLNAQASQCANLSKSKALSKSASDEMISLVPGLDSGASPALAKTIGDIPKEALADVKAAMAKYPNYQTDTIDAEDLMTELKAIRGKHLVKAYNAGVSSYAGVSGGFIGAGTAGYLISAGVITVNAPVLVVVGAGALGGYAAGKVISWLFTPSSCSTKAMMRSSGSCTLNTGTVASGGALPSIFGEKGTIVISVPGFVPVTITNFNPPQDGKKLIIDFKPVPIDSADPGDSITVNFEELVPTANACSDILSASIVTTPPDPDPYQSVSVTVSVFPSMDGCDVKYDVLGTDNYHASGTKQTSSTGQISFSIPGGAKGVHDTVNITTNGKTYTLVYTF
ncbi:MAG: hypothetical protein HQK76_02545 [Desulfobacterales bacterium]|nr:hypothetical protein [Desulfobacterales bacterium]